MILINSSSSVIMVGNALISKMVIDRAVAKDVRAAVMFAVVLGISMIFNIIISGFGNALTVRVSEKMSNSIQSTLTARLFKTEWLSLNRFHSGDMLTRLTSDISSVVDFWISLVPGTVALSIQIVLAFFALYAFDRNLAMFAFLVGPLTALIGFFMGRKLKAIQHEIQKAESVNRSFIHEVVKNILVVKTFENEDESIQKVRRNQMNKFRLIRKKSNMMIASNIAISGGYVLGYMSAFIWGVVRLSSGMTTFGTFTAFLQLVGQIQGPFNSLSRMVPQVASCLASVERLMEYESLALEDTKPEEQVHESFRSLVANDVSYSYIPSKWVFQKLSFEINRGEIASLVGVSGEGKTTVIRLLLSLIKPNAGTIGVLNEGGEYEALSPSTRYLFAYVPQGNTLFSGTIADNVRIGDGSATDADIEEALRLACAWDFVLEMPDKLQTIIGESGTGLSEGQAQRISIARALIRKTPILLLDEATSALDMETENRVLSNIRGLMPQRTCIAITHRMSVADVSDKVFRISSHGLLTRIKNPSSTEEI